MDIRELKLFQNLARTLHFGRTSRACNITPSALTRTIQRLENDLGEQLFTRDNRSVALTAAGEAFKGYAEDVIQRWIELQAELSAADALGGEISLYCSVTAAYSILPDILSKFRNLYPDVHINLQTGDAARAMATLQNGEADVIIAALPEKQPAGIVFREIMETPLVFIAPLRLPETIKYDKSVINWLKTPVIMAEQGLSRERMERWFADKNIAPNIYAQVAGNEAILAMVSLGCGIGVVPQLVVEKSPLQDQILVLDVAPGLKPFSIGICTMKKQMRNEKIKAFWNIAEQERKGA